MPDQKVPDIEQTEEQAASAGTIGEQLEETKLQEEIKAIGLANDATKAQTFSKKVALWVGVGVMGFMALIILIVGYFMFCCRMDIDKWIFIAPIGSLTAMTIALFVASFLQGRKDVALSGVAREGIVRPVVSAASQGTVGL